MFITLEGPEGAGKTSHVSPLVEFIRQQGYPVLSTYEPGGTPISDQVRDVLKNMKNKDMHPRTEILLFCSARAQLVEEVIRPSLAKGYVVVADRYADSTLAYQGYGHGEDLSFLRQLLNYATGSLWPDLTLLLDISAEDGLQRKREQKKDWNRFEDYDLSFHKRVRQGYLELVRAEPQRWYIVDASQSYDTVQEEMRRVVLKKLAARQDKGVG